MKTLPPPIYIRERSCDVLQRALCSYAGIAELENTDSTLRSSRAVPHPSTNRALRRLTSEVRRDPVHSTRYGRQRETVAKSPVNATRPLPATGSV